MVAAPAGVTIWPSVSTAGVLAGGAWPLKLRPALLPKYQVLMNFSSKLHGSGSPSGQALVLTLRGVEVATQPGASTFTE